MDNTSFLTYVLVNNGGGCKTKIQIFLKKDRRNFVNMYNIYKHTTYKQLYNKICYLLFKFLYVCLYVNINIYMYIKQKRNLQNWYKQL